MDRPVPRPSRQVSVAPPGTAEVALIAGEGPSTPGAPRGRRFARTETAAPTVASGWVPSPAAPPAFAHGAYVPTAAYLPGGGFDPGEAYGVDPPLTGFRGRIPRSGA